VFEARRGSAGAWKRWGVELFRSFFERVVWQCVEGGLVDGRKLFCDSSLIEADASCNSVVDRQGLKRYLNPAYRELEARLEEREEKEKEENKSDSPPSSPRQNVVNQRLLPLPIPTPRWSVRAKESLNCTIKHTEALTGRVWGDYCHCDRSRR